MKTPDLCLMLRSTPMYLCAAILIGVLLTIFPAAAQDAADFTVPESSTGSTGYLSAEPVDPDPFAVEWQAVESAIRSGNLAAVQHAIDEVEGLKLLTGVNSLEDYSLFLLEHGNERLEIGEREEAAYFAKKALQLSPDSSAVSLAGFNLMRATGLSSAVGLLHRIALQVLGSPADLISFLERSTYPVLWAFTFGIMLCLVLLFLVEADEMLRTLARKLPLRVRGYLLLPILFLLFVVPLFLGPLAALAVWVLMTYVLLSRFRWIALLGASVIAVWGFILPLKENVGVWLNDRGVKAMLRVANAAHQGGDLEELRELVRRRPNDGVVAYMYGTLLRRYGRYFDAERLFLQAERLLGHQPWTKAQLGTVAFLKGESKQALRYFEEAEAAGLKTAPFYFNFSKIAFDMLDTDKSKELFKKARNRDRDLVDRYQEHEEKLGIHDSSAVAEISLPFYVIAQSGLQPILGVSQLTDPLSAALFWKSKPQLLAVTGVVLVVIFFFVGRTEKLRFQSYYTEYQIPNWLVGLVKLLPGGAWVWGRRPVWCAMIFSFFLLVLSPLTGWPSDSTRVFDLFPGAARFYLYFVAVLALTIYYLSYFVERREDP